MRWHEGRVGSSHYLGREESGGGRLDYSVSRILFSLGGVFDWVFYLLVVEPLSSLIFSN